MTPTIPYITACFERFNDAYFQGSLPSVPIRLSNAKGFLGKLCYRKERKGFFGGYHNTDFILRINTRIDLPESEVEDTILHEMIHLLIAYNQWQDTSAHGEIFRREMTRINAQGNRHISISHRLTPTQQQDAMGKARPHVVCVIRFADGKTGIKVVPRQVKLIFRFHREVWLHFPIESLHWYYATDPYFEQFPSSVALKIQLITDITALDVALRSARQILCDGQTIRLAPK